MPSILEVSPELRRPFDANGQTPPEQRRPGTNGQTSPEQRESSVYSQIPRQIPTFDGDPHAHSIRRVFDTHSDWEALFRDDGRGNEKGSVADTVTITDPYGLLRLGEALDLQRLRRNGKPISASVGSTNGRPSIRYSYTGLGTGSEVVTVGDGDRSMRFLRRPGGMAVHVSRNSPEETKVGIKKPPFFGIVYVRG